MRVPAICALLLATSASAGEMRYPATGAPAVTFAVPDGWSAKEADGKLQAVSADGSATVTMAIVAWTGSMEALADETLKAAHIDPPIDKTAVSIAGVHGFMFHAQQKDAGGKVRAVMFCDAMLGSGKALTGVLVAPDEEAPGRMAGLRMLDRLTLVP